MPMKEMKWVTIAFGFGACAGYGLRVVTSPVPPLVRMETAPLPVFTPPALQVRIIPESPRPEVDAFGNSKEIPQWSVVEAGLKSAQTEEEIDQFVERTRLYDLSAVLPFMTPVPFLKGRMEDFIGRFGGEIRLSVEDHRRLPIAMTFFMNGDKVDFKILIEDNTTFKTDFSGTSKPGEIFSALATGSQAIYVLGDRDSTRYFQLYHLEATRQLVGTFYKKWDKPGEYKSVGIVKLGKF